MVFSLKEDFDYIPETDLIGTMHPSATAHKFMRMYDTVTFLIVIVAAS